MFFLTINIPLRFKNKQRYQTTNNFSCVRILGAGAELNDESDIERHSPKTNRGVESIEFKLKPGTARELNDV
jgi:hypothetical protein